MSNPQLVKARVLIEYSSDDGYKSSWECGTEEKPTPDQVLLNGLEELTRLTALFGLHAEAKKLFDAMQENIASFHAERAK